MTVKEAWTKTKNFFKKHKKEVAIVGACAAGGIVSLAITQAIKNSNEGIDSEKDLDQETELEYEHNPDLDITLDMRFFDEDGNEYLPEGKETLRCTKMFADDMFDCV